MHARLACVTAIASPTEVEINIIVIIILILSHVFITSDILMLVCSVVVIVVMSVSRRLHFWGRGSCRRCCSRSRRRSRLGGIVVVVTIKRVSTPRGEKGALPSASRSRDVQVGEEIVLEVLWLGHGSG
jgi:hypothetical protein